jgi:hypothetical protein
MYILYSTRRRQTGFPRELSRCMCAAAPVDDDISPGPKCTIDKTHIIIIIIIIIIIMIIIMLVRHKSVHVFIIIYIYLGGQTMDAYL